MKSNITIISEIGINHNGDLDVAKRLIDISKIAGCDVVKFQKRNPDVCVPEHQKETIKSTPWGDMTYIEYKHRMEFGDTEYKEIQSHCKSSDIDWSVSVWDLDSLDFIRDYDISLVKIPSALLTDLELIEACKSLDKKIVLSTGMSTVEEIDLAVDCLDGHDFSLLHCNSTYPAPIEDINLRCISGLKERYECEVGYSGHEFGLTTTIASICLGATVIERHITLDRTMWGTDQMCSVEPHGLIKLVKGIRELEMALGDGVKRITEDEKLVRDKLRK